MLHDTVQSGRFVNGPQDTEYAGFANWSVIAAARLTERGRASTLSAHVWIEVISQFGFSPHQCGQDSRRLVGGS